MQCKSCKYPDSKVVRTMHDTYNDAILYRRRECLRCGDRFTTKEELRPDKSKDKR